MRNLYFPAELTPVKGDWTTVGDINVRDVRTRDIYLAPHEPSYVAWAILWKERSGALKLSFVEATGDRTAWPPTYNFNSGDIEYYLKTLVSTDGGESWRDTLWREDLDPLWERNPDHHIRHVFEVADGTLVRNYCHTIEGITSPSVFTTYDKTKEEQGEAFPFSHSEIVDTYPKFSSIWTSSDDGESWKEVFLFDRDPPFFIAAIHPLRDGTLFALGAFRVQETDFSSALGAFTESTDGGRTWSEPTVIATNDDRLNPQGIGEEADFVEIDDNKLLVIWRTDAAGSCMRQMTLERDSEGSWKGTQLEINHSFPHSGYPCMHRASDGTVFYYCHTSLKYSCDDGETWGSLPPGHSYYGQLTEVSPGRMLAVTQRNIGDCSFPWKHDTSMLQTTFSYERIGVVHQGDAELSGALAALDVGDREDFHVAMELKVDAAVGLAYQVSNGEYRFVALTIAASESRLPTAAAAGPDGPVATPASVPQNAFLQIGRARGDELTVHRKVCVGKMIPGGWAELQVSRTGDVLKVAADLCTGEGWGPTYTTVRDEGCAAGGVALFAGKSTGAFRNVRFSSTPEPLRDNWFRSDGGASRHIALDAGRGE